MGIDPSRISDSPGKTAALQLVVLFLKLITNGPTTWPVENPRF